MTRTDDFNDIDTVIYVKNVAKTPRTSIHDEAPKGIPAPNPDKDPDKEAEDDFSLEDFSKEFEDFEDNLISEVIENTFPD